MREKHTEFMFNTAHCVSILAQAGQEVKDDLRQMARLYTNITVTARLRWKVMISSNSLSGNLIVDERSPVRIRYLGWPVLR